MPPAPVLVRAARLPYTYRVDQRSHCRYPITSELEYKLLNKGRVERSGFGRMLNISSRGVLFDTDNILPASGRIELTIPWPFRLEGICPLKLVMRGRIVRSDGNGIAIRSDYYEFRTSGARSTRS